MVTLLLHSASVLIVPSSSPDSGGCFSHREPRSVSPTCLSDERLGQTSDVLHNKYVHNVTQSGLKAFYTDRGTSGKQHGELCDVETIGTEAASDGDVGYHSIGSGDHEQTILAGSRETDRQRVPHKQTFPMMGSRSTSSYFAQAARTDVGRYDADVISGVGRCQRVVVDVRYDDYCPTTKSRNNTPFLLPVTESIHSITTWILQTGKPTSLPVCRLSHVRIHPVQPGPDEPAYKQ